MRWFAKRFFTLRCKFDQDEGRFGGCRIALFSFRRERFFVWWWRGVFAGVFAKYGCFAVVFLW